MKYTLAIWFRSGFLHVQRGLTEDQLRECIAIAKSDPYSTTWSYEVETATD
jgi:hypothetical protein